MSEGPPRIGETRLWLLEPEQVREQLLVVASGSRQLAFPAGAVDGVGDRGTIHPAPMARERFLGVVTYRGELVPLVSDSTFETEEAGAGFNKADFAWLDTSLQAGPLLMILRQGEELLGVAFERFVGFHSPESLGLHPPKDLPAWVKRAGQLEHIPVFVVDTPLLFEYVTS